VRKYASHIKKNTFFIARRIAAGKTEDGGPTIPYHPPPPTLNRHPASCGKLTRAQRHGADKLRTL